MSRYNTTSKYEYPNTGVLINNFDEKDPEKLKNLETTLTTRRIYELYEKPIVGSFGLKHLQKIHKYIFQDIYPFAGKIRDEGIQKGTTTFAPPAHIHSWGNGVISQLKKEKYLKGLNKEQFVERASFYLSEINMLHPFREGNGRVQREYFRLLAMKNGFELNWTNISPDEMLNASVKSVLDSTAFKDILTTAIENEQPDKSLINHYKQSLNKEHLEL